MKESVEQNISYKILNKNGVNLIIFDNGDIYRNFLI